MKILLTDTNLLILDEPTNHLDIKTREIFQNALLSYQGTILIVSHDRYFLDCLVGRVFELRDGVCHEYRGNYSYFIEKRREEQSAALAYPARATGSPGGEASRRTSRVMQEIEGEGGEQPETGGAKPEDQGGKAAGGGGAKPDLAGDLGPETATWPRPKSGSPSSRPNRRKTRLILCEPEIYRDPERIKLLNQELRTISTELEDLYYTWNDLTVRIEALEESLRN